MSEISRRNFLIKGGAGAAALGALAVLPIEGLAAAAKRPASTHTAAPRTAQVAETSRRSSNEALVMHIPDPSTGEIHFMVGTREIVTTDKALVARIFQDMR